ncbi:hypothetical protein CLERM_357 [Coxiella-like endosymbiont]|nr:hypothetical protein CLERM_357 [Coxiella-like endosymbiont]
MCVVVIITAKLLLIEMLRLPYRARGYYSELEMKKKKVLWVLEKISSSKRPEVKNRIN